jgi:hypothetical protein
VGVFALTVILAATGLLQRPEGFAQVISTPAEWLARFDGDGQGATSALFAAVVHAPTIVFFGLAGIALGLRRGASPAGLLAVWTGVGFFVVTVSGVPLVVAELLLPLSLAGGVAIALLLDAVSRRFKWAEEGAMAAILVPLLVVLYTALWGAGTAARAAGLAGLVVLPLVAWGNGSALNYASTLTLREPLRPTFVTPDVDRLIANLESASWNRTSDPQALAARVDPALAPVLAWPLRNRPVTWAAATGEVSDEAVIRRSLTTDVEGFGPEPYVGGTYVTLGSWQRSFPADATETDPNAGARSFARWFLQRRSPGTAPDADMAYERADFFLKAEE